MSFDGKSVRRACEKGKDGRAPHVESAWADGAGVCLGQVRVAEKENEIVAIPKLVRRLFLEGAVLTFDAMGCQREIAAAFRDARADYLLPLKDNQPTLSDEVTRFMRHVMRHPCPLDGQGTKVYTTHSIPSGSGLSKAARPARSKKGKRKCLR